MTEKLVVCFRWHDVESEPLRYFAAAQRIREQLASAGGDPVSWGADRYSFEFDPADFPLVLRTILALLTESAVHAVGVARRCLAADEDWHFWGPALVVAEALAGSANPGEILLDPEVPEVEQGVLATLGAIPVRVGEQRLSAALLLPGACPADGFRRSVPAPRRSKPPNRITSTGATPMRRSAGDASIRHPSHLAGDDSERPAPKTLRVLDALRSREPEALLSLAQRLRFQGADDAGALRLEALAKLMIGELDEGLRELQKGLRQSVDPRASRRVGLTLAVGYAMAGQHADALLQALEVLAVAREEADEHGELAAKRFIAQLAATAGEAQVAAAWSAAAQA